MDDTSISYYTVGTIAAILFVYTALRLRPSHEPDTDRSRTRLRRPTLVMLGLITVIEFSAAPVTVGAINRLTGVPNFAALWVYCLSDALACSACVLIAYWRDPVEQARRATQRWIAVYTTVIMALIVLFWLGNASVEHRVDFDTAYARTPFISALIVLYLAAYGLGALVITVMTWRWAKVTSRPWLRPGLRILAVGCAVAVGFTVSKLTAVFARMLANRDLDFLSSQVAPGLSAVAVALFATGFVLPTAGDRITQLRAWLRRWRDYHALTPLWTALAEVAPSAAAQIKLSRLDLQVRITARTSMIRDAQIALRPFMDPVVLHRARLATRDLPDGVHRDAVVAAIQLTAALEARQQGHAVDNPADMPDHGGNDGVSELRWLAHVSHAFANSSLAGAPSIPAKTGRDPLVKGQTH